MNADALKIGSIYFMVTFPDPQMTVPVVLTYRYLGKNLPEGVEDNEGPSFYFRYLPPFRSDQPERDLNAVAWSKLLPELFSGWGEDVPTVFPERRLVEFGDIEGLISQLAEVARREQQR